MDNQAIEQDGTWDATLSAPLLPLTGASLVTVRLPAGLAQGVVSGRYFLARCGAQTAEERAQNWQIYLRRPLFIASQRQSKREDQPADTDETWALLLPASPDPGYRWLAGQPVGATVNLLGPLGQGFTLAPHTRHLLLLATAAQAATLLALIDPILDKGGHVTLVLYTDKTEDNPLLPLLPIPVEVRLATNEQQWQKHLTETIQWADQLCAAIPAAMFPMLADLIKRKRFRLETGFAQVLVEADLICGVGACLACVIPLASGGYTRACVHGPVFDLVHLV